MKRIIVLLFVTLFISCDFLSPEDYLHQAKITAEKGKYKEAIKLADKAISKNHKFVNAYIDRAFFYSKLGEEKKSLMDLKKVITIDQKNTLALYNIALIYGRMQNYPMVLYFCNRTFKSKGKGIGGYIEINENAFGNSGKKDISNHLIYFERGIANYNLSKFQDARNDFLMCIEDDYKNAECYYWIGFIYLKTGNSKLACENFNLAKLLGNTENIPEKYCNE